MQPITISIKIHPVAMWVMVSIQKKKNGLNFSSGVSPATSNIKFVPFLLEHC